MRTPHGRTLVRMTALAGAIAAFAVGSPSVSETFEQLRDSAAAARTANQLNEAAALYRRALALRSDWAEGWWGLGTVLYERDDYAGAAGALARAVKLRPETGVGYAMLGLSEAKLGRDAEALQHLARARQLGIGDNASLRPVMLFTEGTLLLNAGQFGRAQEMLGALARDGADQKELITALGLSVLGIKPSDAGASNVETQQLISLAGHAEWLNARRLVEDAEREYGALAAAAPTVRGVQFAYGRFLVENHQDEKAIAAFRREIENSPNHLLARLGIAGLLRVSDPAAGIPYAEQAVKLAPNLAESHYLLGVLSFDTGDSERAVRELEAARKLAPDEAKIYFALARTYTALGRDKDAASARQTFERLTKNAR